MKVSIITVCFNSENTIKDTINSVLSQNYPDIEYIIIDGQSTDNTCQIIHTYANKIYKYISEPDKGIYDAMNKGIKFSNGEVIGLLNSDDVFANNNIISTMVKSIENYDVIYADIAFYKKHDLQNPLRHFSSRHFKPGQLSRGLMPAHPSLYVRKSVYTKFGFYDISYLLCADFDFMCRIFNHTELKWKYIDVLAVKMRIGGSSTRNLFVQFFINKEKISICKKNNISSGWLHMLSRYPYRLLGYIFKKQNKAS
ncbi:Colanic acid biosynthesis glycosyl transferase WcaE [hydrothermal vent metagenome]|uniref:Colanic acid biosynthesis glycosyl transferase WcaE n=1 Tax=hydrothermal vent metagenome TaxID=652676 RepID=A0A3B0WZP8_9ZZZZ